MNSFVALAVLFAVVTVSQAGIDEEKAREILIKCKEETNASEDVDELLKTRELPASHEGKCLVACALQKRGAMKDERIDVEAVGKFIETQFKDDKAKQEQLAKVLAKCALTDVKGLDHCEAAVAYIKCGKDNGLRM